MLYPLVILIAALAGCSGGGGNDGAGAGAGDDGETLVLPLIGEPPAGLGTEALAPALEAAAAGLGYDFATNRLVPLPAAPSVLFLRPGTMILPQSLFPGWCTAAFVFDDRSKIATAGHCTEVGDLVLALALPSTLFVVGRTSQSTGAAGIGDDWALIDVFPEWQVFTDPAVALVGGPCGRAPASFPPLLKFVGHGIGLGAGGTPRLGLYDGEAEGGFRAIGAIMPGDSGAPVLETTQSDLTTGCLGGGAVGILTHQEFVVVEGEPTIPTGAFYGTPISRIPNELDDASLLP